MKLLRDIDVSGKKVFVRADLDIPLEDGVDAATRLTNLKPTVDFLLDRGASRIIIAGHIGRPEKADSKLSTKQLIEPLEKILGQKIGFREQLTIDNSLKEQIVLFENLRFWSGEKDGDLEFAKKLATLADIYVNEAFGTCHRGDASVTVLPTLLPHGAGLHLEKEVAELSKIIKNPQRPFVAIVGGAKLETKVPVIENLSKLADFVLVGGMLPIEIKSSGRVFTDNVSVATLTSDTKDIDSDSQNQFTEIIATAKTVVWNGPLGFYEEGHTQGSLAIVSAISESGAYSVVGGGETVDFLSKHNLVSKFSFVSAGGGAMLEFLSGKKLPALMALG